MPKEVLTEDLGWSEKCSSCDNRTREALIYFSPCSLVKFAKDGNGEPFIIKPDAFIDESGKFNCLEFCPEGGKEQEIKSPLLVFLDESHESELVEKLLQVTGVRFEVLDRYSADGIEVISNFGLGYHSLQAVKSCVGQRISQLYERNKWDINQFELEAYLESEIAKDKAEIEKRKKGDGYVRVTMDEVRAFQEKQKIT